MAINSGEFIKASDVIKALTDIHLRSYVASSNDTTSLVFRGVVRDYRATGLLLINANGIPKVYVCALFTDGIPIAFKLSLFRFLPVIDGSIPL